MPGLDMVGSRKVEQVAAYEREACGETPIIDPESGLMSLSGKLGKQVRQTKPSVYADSDRCVSFIADISVNPALLVLWARVCILFRASRYVYQEPVVSFIPSRVCYLQ
jgi:hypothetical protein